MCRAITRAPELVINISIRTSSFITIHFTALMQTTCRFYTRLNEAIKLALAAHGKGQLPLCITIKIYQSKLVFDSNPLLKSSAAKLTDFLPGSICLIYTI